MTSQARVAAFFVCTLVLTGSAGGNDTEATVQARLALRAFARHFDVEELPSVGLEALASKVMLTEIESAQGNHVKVADSQKLLRATAARMLREYRHDALAIAVADAKSRGVRFSEAETTSLLRPERDERVRSAITTNLDANYENLFQTIRSRVVASQWKQFQRDYFPSVTEIEMAEQNEDSRNAIVSRLVNRISESIKEPAFEENASRLNEQVAGPIVDDGIRQLREQGKVLRESRGGAYRIPKMIALRLRSEIEKLCAAETAKQQAGRVDIPKVYTVFPMVEEQLQERAEQLAVSKFVSDLAERQMPINQERWRSDIRSRLRKDLATHADSQRSWGAIVGVYRKSFTDWVLTRYEDGISNQARTTLGDAEVAGFLSKMRELLRRDAKLGDALDSVIRKSLEDTFDEARERTAREQLRDHFHPLFERSWVPIETPPGEMLVDRAHESSSHFVEHPLELRGITTDGEHPSVPLLEETKVLVRSRAEEMLQIGMKAMATQLSRVRSYAPVFERWAQNKFQGGANPWPNENDLARQMAAAVRRDWQKLAQGSSDFAIPAQRFPKLFHRVNQEIETQVRAMRPKPSVPSVSRRDSRNATNGDSSGRSGPSTGRRTGGASKRRSSPSQPGQEPPDVVVEISLVLGAQAEMGSSGVKVETTGFSKMYRLAEFEDPTALAMVEARLADNVFEQINEAIRRKRGANGKDIDLFIYCRSVPLAPYGAVVFLRQLVLSIRDRLPDNVKLNWLDEVGQPGEAVPDDFRWKSRPIAKVSPLVRFVDRVIG